MRFAKIFSLLFIPLCVTISCKHDVDNSLKIFRFNIPDGLSSLDPAFAISQYNIWCVSQLYNGLVDLDSKMDIKPSLAKSWDISPSGTEYTFYLRNDVKFHNHEVIGNNRKLTAYDIEYSFKRIIDPKTASPGAWIFNDKVLRTANGSISDTCFKAVNDTVFKLYLEKPFPAMMSILTMSYCFVVLQEIITHYGKDFRSNPVGTGPFKFKVWEEGTALIFTKNEKYWRKSNDGKPLPYLDAVKISFIEDKNLALYQFKRGELDLFSDVEEGSQDLIFNHDGTFKQSLINKYRLQKIPYLNTEYLTFNLDETKIATTNPVLNRDFRKALSYAINRDELVLYLRNGMGQAGTGGIIPTGLPSHNPNGYNYDLSKAKEYLIKSGFSTYFKKNKLTLSTVPAHKRIGEYLQKSWSKIGVKTKLEVNKVSTHLSLADDGQLAFFRTSWMGDYPDAENYLSLFYSNNFSPKGPNRSHFSNADFDKKYLETLTISDHILRKKVYQQMDSIMLEECPAIVLYYDEVLWMYPKNISGIETNAMKILKLENVDIKR